MSYEDAQGQMVSYSDGLHLKPRANESVSSQGGSGKIYSISFRVAPHTPTRTIEDMARFAYATRHLFSEQERIVTFFRVEGWNGAAAAAVVERAASFMWQRC